MKDDKDFFNQKVNFGISVTLIVLFSIFVVWMLWRALSLEDPITKVVAPVSSIQ